MKQRIEQCPDDSIADFLAERLGDDEQSSLFEHLNQCSKCREQMMQLAAEPETWEAASNFLSDEDFDSVVLGSSEYCIGSKEPNILRPADGASLTSSVEAMNPASVVRIENIVSLLAPTDDPRMLGRLGGYEISGVIGAGGMGIVLKGHDLPLARIVAIKVLRPHLATSGAARQRFAREAKAAAAVLHPNVIAIHSVSVAAELPYLVMPYVRGRSLQKRLDDHGHMELKEVLRVGCQVAAGLAAAHAQGLVHRDIKPANILLEDGVERVTITDFGLARAVDDATLTRSGVITGTPQYMSPEQAGGESIDARSDLFSLGSMLYTMCAGRPAFRAETSLGVLRRIIDDTPRPLCEINPEIPTWMGRLVERLHAKLPEQRFQTAAEVEHVLQSCLAHLEQPSRDPLPDCLGDQTSEAWNKYLMAVFLSGLFAISVALWASSANWFGAGATVAQSSSPPIFDATETPGQAAKPDSTGSPVVEAILATNAHDNGGATLEISPDAIGDASWEDGIGESLTKIDAIVDSLEETFNMP